MQSRIIVLGAGHNGLVTAFYLARAGLRPLVLERRPIVGGVATTEEIAGGVRGPALAHALGPLRHSIVRDMRLRERGVEFIEPDPALVALTPDGRHAAFHRDPVRTERSVGRLAARDAERYPAFAAALGRMGAVLRELLEMAPPDVERPELGDLWRLLSTARRFRALPRQDAFRLLRWMPMAVADLVSEFFEHDTVQAAMAARALTGTNLGPWSAATGALLLLHAAADPMPGGSGTTAVGGPGAVTRAMAEAAAEAGAEIRTGAAVARIETGAVGVEAVRLESGEAIAASAVISNADPRRTFLELLDPTVLDPGFVTRVTHYRARGTTAKINLVVSAIPRFSALGEDVSLLRGRLHIAPGIDYLERAFDASKYGRCAESPWLDVAVPTVADSTFDTGKHVVSVIAHYAPFRLREGGWAGEREAFADRVVRVLDEYAPGFAASVIARQVLTPQDLEDRFALTGGHIHHGEPSLDQMFFMRPVMGWARYATPVRGLYLCGGGTHPGLGLTGGSGQNAAREILRKLK
ncbi:MAG TPA: NAD(P)/FAD-dependent oxidoreductase [Vicinamibacterales bacterium]|nr:NAD(P)/FAD-dependent oxidoreductase [Vicinamibacterales bacterium]